MARSEAIVMSGVSWLVAAGAPKEVPALGIHMLFMLLPVVGFLLVLPLIYFVFRRTWRELDKRPLVLFVLTAAILTLQWYYDRDFFMSYIKPWLKDVEAAPSSLFGLGEYVSLKKYGDLYSLSWWVFTRVFGYTVVPFTVWKIFFPKDSLLDMGLRTKGFVSHAWIYLLCLVAVIPAVFMVASQPEFANYYPFYKRCSRSWVDLLAWEAQYVLQFFGLEIFFRGFWLNGLRRSMGSSAIFAMTVPYCMIHYGKPYLETCGAIIAGIALGSLSMRTKSIYAGFLVHVTVAILMDFLAISAKEGLPTTFFPP